MNKRVRLVTLAALLLATSLVFATGGASAETVSSQVTQVVINDETYTVTTSDYVDTTYVDGSYIVQYVVDGQVIYLQYVDSVQADNLVAAYYTTADGTNTVTVNSCSNCVQNEDNVI